jgi:enterobacterial common antigen flippase
LTLVGTTAGRRNTVSAAMSGGVPVIFAGTFAGYGANALTLLITARILGSTGRGMYSGVLVWVTLASILCHVSLGPAFGRQLAVGTSPRETRRILTRVFVPAAVASSSVAFVFLRFVIPTLVAGRAVLISGIVIPPALVIVDWASYAFAGLARPLPYAIARCAQPILNTVIILGLAVAGFGVTGAIASFAVSAWLAAGICAIFSLRHMADPRGTPPQAASALAYGARSHPGTLAAVANSRLDVLFLSRMVSASQLGLYSVAVSMTMPIAAIGGTLAPAWFRRFARNQMSSKQTRDVLWRSAIPAAGLAIVAIGAVPGLPYIFGPAFAGAAFPTIILAIGAVGFAVIYVVISMLQARNRPLAATTVNVFAAIMAAITLLVLVPLWGVTGAAASSAATYLLTALLGGFVVSREPC